MVRVFLFQKVINFQRFLPVFTEESSYPLGMKFIPMFLNFYGYDMGMKCHIYSCVEFIPITYHFIPPPSYPSFLPLI